MNKRVTALVFAATFICTQAFAHDIEVNNAQGITIYYNYVNEKAELSVTFRGEYPYQSGSQYNNDIIIPETVDYNNKTYKVTSIGDNAFMNCTKVNSVQIPNSIVSIGKNAFWHVMHFLILRFPVALLQSARTHLQVVQH